MTAQFISLKLTNNLYKCLALAWMPLQYPIRCILYYFLMLNILMWPMHLTAETVQRWQDQSGQWHFGDHAAAKGHTSRPVLVSTPISIIKNEQPVAITDLHPQKNKSKSRQRKSTLSSLVRQKSNHCEQLRQQLYDHGAKPRKKPDFQALSARYEHECVAGQYYGN